MTTNLGPLVRVHLKDGHLQPGQAPPAPRPDTLARALLRQRYQASKGPIPTDAELDAELAELLRGSHDVPRAFHFGEEVGTLRHLTAVADGGRLAECEALIRNQHDAALDRIGRAMADRAHVLAGGRTVISFPAGGGAPTTRQEAGPANAFAKHGAEGAEVRRPSRTAAVTAAVRKTAALALARRAKGLPFGEGRWSVETLVHYLRDDWDPQPGPKPSTLKGYVRAAVAAKLMPAVSSWSSEA